MNPESPHLSNPDLRPVLRRWADPQSSHALFERLDAAVRLRAWYTTTQVNVSLLLEAFMSEGAGNEG
jgi:hypothetical protein